MILPEGLAVGQLAPDFSLPTSEGEELTLSKTLADRGPVILTFYHLAFTDG